MENDIYSSLITSLNQSLDFTKGNNAVARKKTVTVSPIPNFKKTEIKQIRYKLGLSQRNFAMVLGISSKTVEAWESGKNAPQGIARRFLQLLDTKGDQLIKDCGVIST